VTDMRWIQRTQSRLISGTGWNTKSTKHEIPKSRRMTDREAISAIVSDGKCNGEWQVTVVNTSHLLYKGNWL
jgi:hypothetical protein